MLLAELNIRHTRRHMPTRRVAVEDGYLPTSGTAFGGVLIGAVVAEHLEGLDEEQLDALAAGEEKIVRELNDVQGSPVDIGGYYFPDETLATAAMRPSSTFNAVIDTI